MRSGEQKDQTLTTDYTPDSLPSIATPACLRHHTLRALCVRAWIARAVVTRMADRVPVDLLLPDGRRLGGGQPTPGRPALLIHRDLNLFERLAHHPKVGVGEAYMAGDWSAAPGTDLAEAITPFAERVRSLLPRRLHRLRWLTDRRHRRLFANTIAGARSNIRAHYDLSNEMFEAFLDPTMSYSSARFDPDIPMPEQSLGDAQHRKIRAVLDAADVRVGSRVLEIGSGWGSLAIEAARRGAEVVTLTLSVEQAELARRRAAEAHVADRVEVRVEDYRQASGLFDAVVSVEMIEAVGEEYWPDYFRAIDSRLAPGGRVAIQAILMDHDRFLTARRSSGWVNKHIFPGGVIPSLSAIDRVTRTATSLRRIETEHFAADYAETLRRWRRRFMANWTEVEALGFDLEFQRRWEFYLAFCEAGFRGGALDVALLTFARPGERGAAG